MYAPRTREIVEMAGSPDLFVVLWVDGVSMIADLMALRDNAYSVNDVPFARLRRHDEEAVLKIK
jgi:hypothetical protein